MYLNPFEAKFYIKELSIHLHYEWLAKSISKCVWDGCEGWVKSIFRNDLWNCFLQWPVKARANIVMEKFKLHKHL